MFFPEFHLRATSLSHFFQSGSYIIKNFDFSLSNSAAIALTGKNGSGKSTTLKILSGSINPVSGKVDFYIESKPIKQEQFNNYFGFVAPYLELYNEFNPIELIKLTSQMRGKKFDKDRLMELINKFGLSKSKNRLIKQYSSGMIQRVRFIQAIYHSPPILFLDEPMSNLDKSGIECILNVLNDHLSMNGGIVIASNDDREISICKELISIERFSE